MFTPWREIRSRWYASKLARMSLDELRDEQWRVLGERSRAWANCDTGSIERCIEKTGAITRAMDAKRGAR